MHEINLKEKKFGHNSLVIIPTVLTLAFIKITTSSYCTVFHGLIHKGNWHRQIERQIQQKVSIQHCI